MPGPENLPPEPTVRLVVHKTIGVYRLLRLIGEGAMSQVFLAYDPRHFRQVAIKILAEHLSGDKVFVNRFYREAKMSRSLTHPGLVHGLAYGFDASASRHYLVLEYVDGPNALAVLDRAGPLPVGAVVKIGLELGQVLAYLHHRGFVHRDVKPDNVLLGPAGTVKLGDLGLAKRLHGDVELTTTTQGVGTPHYMPYEQSVNGDLVDGRSDLFALGATLYHLLTGHVPFRGTTLEEIVREKAQNAYLPAREFRDDIPPIVEVILSRLLACDPRARFQSASELVQALNHTGLSDVPSCWSSLVGRDHGVDLDPEPTSQTRADLPLAMPTDTPTPMAPVKSDTPETARPVPTIRRRRFFWSTIGFGFLSLTLVMSLLPAVIASLRSPCPPGTTVATKPTDCTTPLPD